MRFVIYPGSFDPITNGHLDVIQRAARLFDKVIVAIARNESKHPLFTLEERKQMVAHAVQHLGKVEADSFDGLLIDYCERRSAQAIIRGLRAVSDFEFEFQLALMNRKLDERIETIFHDAEGYLHFPEFTHREGNRILGGRRQRVCAGARADGPPGESETCAGIGAYHAYNH